MSVIDTITLDDVELYEREQLSVIHTEADELESYGWRVWYPEIFPHIFRGQLATYHEEALDWYWNALLAVKYGLPFPNDENAFISIWSRAFLKSTIARTVPITQAALLRRGYCLYLGATQPLADDHLSAIESLLLSGRVRKYYPDLAQVKVEDVKIMGKTRAKSWSQKFMYTQRGYVIRAVGLEVGIRGANVDDVRPTLIVPDDIDDIEDSPDMCKKKVRIFTRSILPTKQENTIFWFAQNLIHDQSVLNQIYTGKVRALAGARISGPHKAIENLTTVEQTINGRIFDIVTGGTPTWSGYPLTRAQADINDFTLEGFKAEFQHELDADKTGRVLPSYNDKVHVITKSEFARIFGTKEIPKHWTKYVVHDWAKSKSDFHNCVVAFLTVSAANSAFPGAVFVYDNLTFKEGTEADDVGLAILKKVAPQVDWDTLISVELTRKGFEKLSALNLLSPELTAKIQQRRNAIAGAVREKAIQTLRMEKFNLWHMSHEAKGARDVYRDVFGLPFEACNPGASGGVEELNHFLKVDYKEPHPFRLKLLGFTRFFIIVDDDQLENPKGDRGAELLRYQLPHWQYTETKVTSLGGSKERPRKMFDDFGNCLVGETLVQTETGEKPIKDIKAGEKVWTRQGLKKVIVSAMTSPSSEVYKVTFSNNKTLTGTGEHPIWVEGTGWTHLCKLSIDSIMFQFHIGSIKTAQQIVVKKVQKYGYAPVYNLEVEGTPEFYANGVLVHNCLQMLFCHKRVESTPLNYQEKIQEAIPAQSRYENLLQESPFEQGLTIQQQLEHEFQVERAKKNVKPEYRRFGEYDGWVEEK